jgi:flagellar biosynthesis GTPase FlhF
LISSLIPLDFILNSTLIQRKQANEQQAKQQKQNKRFSCMNVDSHLISLWFLEILFQILFLFPNFHRQQKKAKKTASKAKAAKKTEQHKQNKQNQSKQKQQSEQAKKAKTSTGSKTSKRTASKAEAEQKSLAWMPTRFLTGTLISRKHPKLINSPKTYLDELRWHS